VRSFDFLGGITGVECGDSGKGEHPSCAEGDGVNGLACGDDNAALRALSSEFFRRENKPIDSDIGSCLFLSRGGSQDEEGGRGSRRLSMEGVRFKRRYREGKSRG